MTTTSRSPATLRLRRGTGGPRLTCGARPRARLLRALQTHAGLLRALLLADEVGGSAAPVTYRASRVSRRRRTGNSVDHPALGSLIGPLAYLSVTTASAAVHVPTDPDSGGWALVHAPDPQTRRSLRRRWFPWTLRAWLPTARDGALALFSWGPGTTSG